MCSHHCVQSVSDITLWTTAWARISILTFSRMGEREIVLQFHEAKPFTETSEALICANYLGNSVDVNCVVFGLLEGEVGCVMPQVGCSDLQ